MRLMTVFPLSLSLSLSFSLFSANGSWTSLPDFPGGKRTHGVGFSIGTLGFMGLGRDSGGMYRQDLWRFDPMDTSWTQIADIPAAGRTNAVGFSIGNFGYIGGGITTSNLRLSDFWEYDPALNNWQQMPDMPGGKRDDATGIAIGSQGYVISGWDSTGGSTFQNMLRFTPMSDSWNILSLPFIGRGPGIGFSINGKGYFGTGNNSLGAAMDDFWEFDPASGGWMQKANVPDLKCNASGFVINGKGYVSMGQGSTPFTSDIYAYDPGLNSWTTLTPFPGAPRSRQSGFAVGNKGYIGIGRTTAFVSLQDFWEFDPSVLSVNNPPFPQLKIYPSIVQDHLNIELGTFCGNHTLHIMDMQGKEILSSHTNKGLSLDCTSLFPGTYFVIISGSGRAYTQKFIKT